MAQHSYSDIGACTDVAECECVENVIKVIVEYYKWNLIQLNKDSEHLSRNYSDINSVLYVAQKNGTNPQPQLTKSSSTIAKISKYDDIICEFMDNKEYNLISLINDFEHIVIKHCNTCYYLSH